MSADRTTPLLAHRAYAVFTEPMPDQVAMIHGAYKAACRGSMRAITEQIALEKELRDLESDDDFNVGAILVAFQRRREIHRRLAELAHVITEETSREEMAVVVAEAARAAGAMFETAGLTASSTFAAHMAGIQEGIERVDEPLTEADRARIQQRRSR